MSEKYKIILSENHSMINIILFNHTKQLWLTLDE